MSNTQLRVSDLDFDSIKENLKEFLRSKEDFKDYDFDGSGMSVLLSALAYNTHYEAIIANQLASELTIDTARNETVVALHAKRHGYIPRSWRAASAIVNLEVIAPSGSPSFLTLGTGANFTSSANGTTVTFRNNQPATTSLKNGKWIFESVKIFQGELKTFRYLVKPTLRAFEIPDDKVDISHLRVFVQESSSNTTKIEYQVKKRLVDVNSESNVFYIGVNQRGKYEIYFGDGVLGKSVVDGNIVILDYLICDGEIGNSISSFYFDDTIQGNSNIITTTVQKSSGGATKETIEEVRFNAYANTFTQDRAVTVTDYKQSISELISVKSVSTWGGEDNDPPTYGKVFCCVKPLNSDNLSNAEKGALKNSLKTESSIVTITPEFVDVDYLYLIPKVYVYIDDTKNNKTIEAIKSSVIQNIIAYSSLYLEQFNSNFRKSKFTRSVDDVDASILSNIASVTMKKVVSVNLGFNDRYETSFYNPIKRGTLTSSKFKILTNDNDVYFTDVNGNIALVYIDGGVVKTINPKIGTIDYFNGKIVIPEILISSSDTAMMFYASSTSEDIITKRNCLIKIEESYINVTVLAESSNPDNHVFPSIG